VALERGKYVFGCLDCDGKGSIEVIVGEDETVLETCDECGGSGQVTVDEQVADTYVVGTLTPLSTPDGVMGPGQRVCPECGRTYNVDQARAGFDRANADSTEWKWDDLPQPLCQECAQTDAEARWTAGKLESADGPPPSPERQAELMERFGIGEGNARSRGGFSDRFRR
jgi:hypothetical protein